MSTIPTPNAILIQDVKVGEKFYMLNKAGLPKLNGNTTFLMERNNGRCFEYVRLENDRAYQGTTLYPQYVVVL
jgi:hypothetical protein